MRKQIKERSIIRMTVLALLLWGMMCTGSFAAHDHDAMPDLPADGSYALSVGLHSSNPDGSKTNIRGYLDVKQRADQDWSTHCSII